MFEKDSQKDKQDQPAEQPDAAAAEVAAIGGYEELHADDIPEDAEERVNRIVEAVNERVDRIVTAVNDSISSAACNDDDDDVSIGEHVRSDSLAAGELSLLWCYAVELDDCTQV